MTPFNERLARLRGVSCESVESVQYEEPPTDPNYAVSTSIRLSDGTAIDAQFWRLLRDSGAVVSIFDHGQRYGLPAEIDAIESLRGEVVGKPLTDATMDDKTGDLLFRFEGGLALQVFNFTDFEIWTVRFPDGIEEYSNHALRERPPLSND